MDSGLGSSSVEDMASVDTPAVVVTEESNVRNLDVQFCCQEVSVEGGDCAKCGESRSLNEALVEDLNQLFLRRLQIVQLHGNDIHHKIAIYEDWVSQLRQVNLDLIRTIKELQDTCSDRLVLMKANYKKNLARFGQDAFQRIESDQHNLKKMIRRAAVTGNWNLDGIQFYDIHLDDLFGKNITKNEVPAAENVERTTISVNLEFSSNGQQDKTTTEQLLMQLKDKERHIKELEELLDQNAPISEFRSTDCALTNKNLVIELKQLVYKKDHELKQQTTQIEDLCTEIKNLQTKIDEYSQFDADLTNLLADFKIEGKDSSNKELLQMLREYYSKSTQLEDANDEHRNDIKRLHDKVFKHSNRDNESLINEINDYHDKNCRLEKKIREMEQELNQAHLALAHRKNVIDSLRQAKSELNKSLMLATAGKPNYNLQKSVSNTSNTTASTCSSESTTSLGSFTSDSSSGTLKAFELNENSAEQIQRLKKELSTMSEHLQQLRQSKQAQDCILAKQCSELEASEAELKIVRNDYENINKKLFFIRTKIMELINVILQNFNGRMTVPISADDIEAIFSKPLIGKTTKEQCDKDVVDLERLKLYLEYMVKGYNTVINERTGLCTMVDAMKEKINDLQRSEKQYKGLIDQLKQTYQAMETKDKETSMDFDILPVSVDNRETLAAQRLRVQTVLHDMAMEIACLIGKNLSSDTLSSFSELDAAPLHCLITDLKKEIESKDQVLIDRRGCIKQLEQEVLAKEKELHRLNLRLKTADTDIQSYKKRNANLQRALQDHDEAIPSLKQCNHDLQQHLEDMKITLKTHNESIRRLSDEKADLEDECKNQLITISNLRTALEETKRNGSSSVSLPSILGGSNSSSPTQSGHNSQYLQPQHHYHTSNNANNSNFNHIYNNSNNTNSGTSYWSAFWRA